MLGTTAKSETCASLGLSSMAVAGCIEDLKPALNVRYMIDHVCFAMFITVIFIYLAVDLQMNRKNPAMSRR